LSATVHLLVVEMAKTLRAGKEPGLAMTKHDMSMKADEIREAIRIRIGEQIEIIAKQICEGGNPIHAQWLLEALCKRLEDEETASV